MRFSWRGAVNSVGLIVAMVALVVLMLGLLMSLRRTWNEGLTSSVPEDVSGTATTSTTLFGDPASVATTTTTIPIGDLHAPGEVTVLVGNGAFVSSGARQVGLAGAASKVVSDAGYNTVARNAEPAVVSIVYHATDYRADALTVAALLGIPSEAVGGFRETIEVDPGQAQVVVVLGPEAIDSLLVSAPPPVTSAPATTTTTSPSGA
ncbi:MAG: LytR C-terminal domain-containing protein [Actinomycetia bacterium]|nr:LytR C-terminal domain-containing protein [Actinomycetes bacterium]MCP3912079.1 LytR C-terminal domain-containing protein [Actinomycetes bacterium]MCP4086382.1 LytR C-terminal domain-containing protein [Actinomycetes bacterium]